MHTACLNGYVWKAYVGILVLGISTLLVAYVPLAYGQSPEGPSAREARMQELAPGLERGHFPTGRPAGGIGDSTLVVLRVDPEQWRPRVRTMQQFEEAVTPALIENANERRAPSGPSWAQVFDVPIVTNAGMFATDHRTHVGYLRTRQGVHSARVNRYQSVAAFDPKPEFAPGSEAAGEEPVSVLRMYDRDDTPLPEIRARYETVIQNLRLIKRPGENRWSMQEKRWSEMALAEDRSGHIVLVYSRTPYPMHTFNEILLDLPLGIVAAQHLEGGPEAQLVMRSTDAVALPDTTYVGSYETGFYPNDRNRAAWFIPVVMTFEPR
jgi:hypothetical protein